ncbi:hypothetical protein ACG3SL_02465 [Sphingomonas sp. CJ20]
MTDPIAALWQEEAPDATALPAATLAAAEARLRSRVRRRDAIEYVAGAFAMLVFARTAWIVPDWGVRIGCIAIILGTFVTLRNLWRRRPAEPDSAAPGLAFYRAQLAAQRDALASVWRWYLLPPLPGMVLLLGAVARVAAAHLPLWATLIGVGAAALPVVGVFWGIHALNRRAARALQAQIDALDQGVA